MSSVPRRRSVILSDTDYDYHTDYYDVEWIKSNGTGNNNTWIDTNVEMTWDIIVDTKVYGHYTYWDKIFHAGAAGGYCEFQSVNQLGGYYGSSVWTYSSGMVRTDTEFSVRMGQGQAKINNSTVILTPTHFATTNHIYLLGNKVDGSVMRMYYCKIYNGTALIRDMIPVKKKSNNEYGFWDLITNKFYGNGGTVALSGGDIILPDQTYYCYYYGDECEEVTGGWEKVWGSTASESWITVTKNTDNIAIGSTCTGASYDYRVGLATKKPIDGYGKDVRLFCYAKVGGTYPQSWYHVLSGRSAIRDLHQSYYDGDYHEWQSGTIGNSATADYALGVGSIIDPTHTSTNWNYDIRLAQTNFGGTTYIKAMGYAFGDDLSGLSAYGDNDTRILGKMEAIMANNTARNYLLKQCSGSLMWACVNNSVFRDAVQRSGHLADFTGHARWSKAMNMAGTWTAKSAHPGAEPLTDFDQLEYISEQNNAFINTKYVPTNTSGFEVVASKSTSDTTSSVLLGSKEYNDSRWFANIVQTVNFGWNTDLTGPSYTANSKVTIKLNYLNDRKMCVNDTQVSTISSTLDAQNKAVAYIFGYNNNGNESSMNVNAKIYSVKISENGKVVKEFIPVRRKSDSEVGMYEKISGVFYGNISKTTGSTFVAGPKIEPVVTGYTQLEYIESTGTQYINTNYIPLAADKFIMDFQTVSTTNTYEAIFGARQGWYLYKAYCFFVRFAGSNYYRFNRTGAETLLNNGMYNKRVTLTTQNKTASWTDGSTTYSGSTTGTVEDCTNALFLFNLNTAGAGGAQVDTSPSKIKLYSFEVVRDGSTIHKYIPMKRDSDGAIGLYDQINQIFLTNSGSGTFTPGPEIHPTEDKVTFYDYIDITGGGKIPTGIYPNSSNTMNCYIDVEVPDLTHRYCLLTTYENESSHYNCFELNVSSQKRVVTRLSTDTSAVDNTSTAIDGLRHKFHLYCTGNTYRIDNWQTTNNRAITTTNKSYTIGSDYRSSASPFNTIRVFSCKIIENNVVVRDLIPAKNNTNNKWCLYDKINKVCYYDVGNGTVSGGNLEKAITGYQLLDWIQSNGSAYADLDYKNFDEIKFMADCKFRQTELTPTDKWHYIFGSHPSNDDNYHLMGLGYASSQVAVTRTLRGFGVYTDFQLYFSNIPVGDTELRDGFIEANAFGVNGVMDTTFKTTAKAKSSYTNANSIHIFSLSNFVAQSFKGKIYKFKLYNEGKPVIDLAPVKRISDGVYGFYDRIRSRFFSSSTSTAFTGGYDEGSYEELEYIESSGTQYIDTGVIAKNTTGFYVMAQKSTNDSADAMVIGSRNGSDGRCWIDIDHSGTNNGAFLLGWNTYTGSPEQRIVVNLSKFTAKVNYLNDRKVIINDAEAEIYSSQLSSTLNTQNTNLYIFGANVSGTGFSFPFTGKIYSIKITDSATVIRNFVPVRRLSDNTICMYDKVSQTFFENTGTGVFNAGPVKSEYTELEYIESTGTQYIDTEISGGTNAEYEVKLDPLSTQYIEYEQYYAGDKASSIPKCFRNASSSGTINFQSTINGTAYGLSSTIALHTVKWNKNGTINIDGTDYSNHSAAASNGWGTLTWWLFGSQGEPNLKSSMRLYCMKMWTNSVLVRDFIPVKRTADNIVCLYDKVTNKYFYNKGTGEFTAGPEKPTVADKLFTATDFNAGTFIDADRSGSHSVITSLYSGTDGFSIVGTPSHVSGQTGGIMGKWYTSVDLTGYSKITFSGCKVVNHGIIYVQVIDTSTSTAVKTVSVGYGSLVANTWYDYEIDVTELSGTYKFQFMGGYWDASGNTNSQTRYANIKLIV